MSNSTKRRGAKKAANPLGIEPVAVAWKIVSLVCGAAAGIAVERLLSVIWRTAANDEPPKDPANRDRSLAEAIVWGAAVGIGAGVARVVASRSAATVWEAAAGDPPPGVQG